MLNSNCVHFLCVSVKKLFIITEQKSILLFISYFSTRQEFIAVVLFGLDWYKKFQYQVKIPTSFYTATVPGKWHSGMQTSTLVLTRFHNCSKVIEEIWCQQLFEFILLEESSDQFDSTERSLCFLYWLCHLCWLVQFESNRTRSTLMVGLLLISTLFFLMLIS